jgi:hypothetical protein
VEGSCEHGIEPFVFHKMLGSSCVAAQLAASQEGLSSMSEWVRRIQESHLPVIWFLCSIRTYWLAVFILEKE